MNFEYTPLYYSHPVQIMFISFERDCYLGGIAFQDFIISDNGIVIKIEDLMEKAKNFEIDFDDVIIELSWNKLEIIPD